MIFNFWFDRRNEKKVYIKCHFRELIENINNYRMLLMLNYFNSKFYNRVQIISNQKIKNCFIAIIQNGFHYKYKINRSGNYFNLHFQIPANWKWVNHAIKRGICTMNYNIHKQKVADRVPAVKCSSGMVVSGRSDQNTSLIGCFIITIWHNICNDRVRGKLSLNDEWSCYLNIRSYSFALITIYNLSELLLKTFSIQIFNFMEVIVINWTL